jgi:hypothetical protein
MEPNTMPIAIIEPLRTMTPVAVQSSSLTQVAYEHRKAILRVEFRDGSAYQYANVPLRTYHDLLRADSKGAYFNHHIRNRFSYALLRAATPPPSG